MTAIRLQVTAEDDGELRLRGLPIQRGEKAEVIVLTSASDEPTDGSLIELLTHDPAWAWLKDPAEDMYSEQDVQG